jgi:hypothetical protein
MLDHFGVTEATGRRGGEGLKPFIASENAAFVAGRAALAADPAVASKSGRVFASGTSRRSTPRTPTARGRTSALLQANLPEVAAGWRKLDDAFNAYWAPMPYECPDRVGARPGLRTPDRAGTELKPLHASHVPF